MAIIKEHLVDRCRDRKEKDVGVRKKNARRAYDNDSKFNPKTKNENTRTKSR